MAMGTVVASGGRKFVAGALFLAAGVLVSWSVVGKGVDFPVMYVMGKGLLDGANVYLPSQTAAFVDQYDVSQVGMFYPPATGFTMIPLALLPYPAAKLVWFLAIEMALLFGIRALARLAAPGAAAHVWMTCAAVVLMSAAIRWGMMLLQAAPFVLGLLCLFVAALHGNRPHRAAALAILATAMKMTLAFPFLGLLVLHRRFGALVAALATWVGLNAVGFLRMGTGSFADYRQNMAQLEALNNISSPDPSRPIALPRLDWTYLFYGLSKNLPVSRIAGFALSAAVFFWLLREGLRARTPPNVTTTTLFLMPLVCLGSLCVYHHQYDACLFFAPALLAYLVLGSPRTPTWPALLLAPLLLMILLLPIGRVQGVLYGLFGLPGVTLLKLTFPTAFTLALAGSLTILHRGAARAQEPSQPAELPIHR
jgi:hypothetical protein